MVQTQTRPAPSTPGPTPPGPSPTRRAAFGKVSRDAVLTLAALFFGLPILWLLLGPTKTDSQIDHGFPLSIGNPANILTAWHQLMLFHDGEVLDWIRNSVYYTTASVVLAVVLSVTAGYGLAKFTFVGRRSLLMITLISMIVPGAALILPLYVEMAAMGLVGTSASVILPAGYYPFGVYLAYVYFTNELPDSLLEAARIDGASELRILMRIVLPLAKPLMGLLSFFSFVGAWSNFLLPYLMLNDERDYPLPLGLSVLPIGDAISGAPNLTGMPTSQGEVILAGLITVAPILVMFLFSQRFLVSAQLAGAEKS